MWDKILPPIIIGCCSLAGAFGGISLKQWWDRRLKEKDVLSKVYFNLTVLLADYWSITVAEFWKREPDPMLQGEIGRRALLIADDLRQIKQSDFVKETLYVLFLADPNIYPSAKVRYEKIKEVIKELGNHLYPCFSCVFDSITASNLKIMAEAFKDGFPKDPIVSNAPGAMVNMYSFPRDANK